MSKTRTVLPLPQPALVPFSERRCAACQFYRQGKDAMECHRFPPAPVSGGMIGLVRTFFPAPGPEDFCGEWTPKQE